MEDSGTDIIIYLALIIGIAGALLIALSHALAEPEDLPSVQKGHQETGESKPEDLPNV